MYHLRIELGRWYINSSQLPWFWSWVSSPGLALRCVGCTWLVGERIRLKEKSTAPDWSMDGCAGLMEVFIVGGWVGCVALTEACTVGSWVSNGLTEGCEDDIWCIGLIGPALGCEDIWVSGDAAGRAAVCRPARSFSVFVKSCWRLLVFSRAIVIQDSSVEASLDSFSHVCRGLFSIPHTGELTVVLIGEPGNWAEPCKSAKNGS